MPQSTFTYRLHGINIVEKAIFRSIVQDEDQFNFQVKTQGGIDLTQKIVVIAIAVVIKKINAEEMLAKFLIVFGYEVANMEEVFEKGKDGQLTIPVEFENVLKAISLSTTRGIIFSELRGTALHNAVLPIIFIDSLKPEPEGTGEELLQKSTIKSKKNPLQP